jgi:hypothetical protein
VVTKRIVRAPKLPAGSWEDPALETRWRKAMKLKEHIGLTDEERYELAQMLPGVDKDDGGSWKELDERQLHDLITMMEGFVLISHLKSMNGWRWVPPE